MASVALASDGTAKYSTDTPNQETVNKDGPAKVQNEPSTSKDIEAANGKSGKQNFFKKTATIALVLMKIEPKREPVPTETVSSAPENDKNRATVDEEVLEKAKRPIPTVRATQVLLVGLLISITVIGCIFVRQCPVEPKIPIYLIVTGVLGLTIKMIVHFYRERMQTVLTLSVTAMLIVHILGSIWVYRIYLPNFSYDFFDGDDFYDSEPDDLAFCHRTVYLFAFWLITIENALLSLFIVISTCYMLMRSSFKSF